MEEKVLGEPVAQSDASKKLAEKDSRALAEVIVYEHANFEGAEWRTNLSYLFVGGYWNDKISSIIVVSGTWAFFQHRDYAGWRVDLRPGRYPSVSAAGIPNDHISSFGWVEGSE